MKFSVVLIFLIGCFACEQSYTHVSERTRKKKSTTAEEQHATPVKKHTPSTKQPVSSRFRAQYYYSDSLGWGYDVLEGNTLRIHQPHIPAIQGNHGFKSEYDAEKAANRVIEKLDHNIMPPTLSVDELRELGVL